MDNNSQETAGKGLTFPCDFVIKVFGLASAEFETAATDIIHKHFPTLSDTDIQRRPSKDGKYNALSFTVVADSREQLDSVYRELTSNPLVLMAL
jgi:putative lipoic acid-binding regulatory protein